MGDRLRSIGTHVSRYGLVVVLLWIGGMKFTTYEAEGIKPLVANSPLMGWAYGVVSVGQFSALLGVVEIAIGLLIALRPVWPLGSAVGSVLAAGMFLTTLTFLVTTPGWEASLGGFPALSAMPGQFLLKDIILLGAALYTAGEALGGGGPAPFRHGSSSHVADAKSALRSLLLLHGFPTSSQMFRKLMPILADKFHVVAPDYPGFGHSSMPSRDEFSYTFDNLSKTLDDFTGKVGLTKYALYVQDYGGPLGFRLAVAHPERIMAIVVQNGNAYDEGLDNDFWKPIKAYWKEPNSQERRDALRAFLTYDATKWQYTHGVKNPELVSPDGAAHDQFLLDRKGNDEVQLDLFLSYGSNPPLYPKWQAYFRELQPPVLIVWGKNDPIFPVAGAEPYKRDLKSLEYHLLDAGHFALETNGDEIAGLMREFLSRKVAKK